MDEPLDLQNQPVDPDSEADTQPISKISESDRLQTLLHERTLECEAVQLRHDQIKLELEALQSDWDRQKGELHAELKAFREACTASEQDLSTLESHITDLKALNKVLKGQNLALQYQLSAWGIPVEPVPTLSGLELEEAKASTFFPGIESLEENVDPAPVVLRGDLSVFYLPHLLGFLETSKLTGILTVLTEEAVTKFFMASGLLRFAAWNRRDPELSLARLLAESELVDADLLDSIEAENLFDYQLARKLVEDKVFEPETVRECLREHARVVLSELFSVKKGAFFLQHARIRGERNLLFTLQLTDALLRTAADYDEKLRTHADVR